VPYLPQQSADIYVLFGVKPQITDYATAISLYVDPAHTGASGLDLLNNIAFLLRDGKDRSAAWADFNRLSAGQQQSLVNQAMALYFGAGGYANYGATLARYVVPGAADIGYDFLGNIARNLGLSANAAGSLFADVVSGNQALTARQKLAIDRVFVDFLIQVGKDRNDPNSPFYGQFGRAYTAISTLFPATLGYTDNNSGVGGNGAATRIKTGKLTLGGSVLETQLGSDIRILGPGGDVIVGSNRRDLLLPNQEGILTLGGGTIGIFTDGTVQLGQSRIMTTQGGDVDLFSANGDLLAGEGPKTYAANAPHYLICDINGYCIVNPTGLVTGAGIAALVTLPGQDSSKSNANLFAPHGTIDAGAAGIRVAGSLNIAGLQILNAFNIQVQGTTVGLPTVQGPPIAALTAGNNAAGAAAKTAEVPKQSNNGDQPSIIFVEVVGFGGGDGDSKPQDQPRNKDKDDKRSERQDPDSAVLVLGAGDLKPEARQFLTSEERARLR
jgi:hypothetical protein